LRLTGHRAKLARVLFVPAPPSRSFLSRQLRMGERGPLPGDALPQPLVRLLDARGQAAADAAWEAFVAAYSSLLLQVARSTTTGHDAAMDAYAFTLDQLREHDCHRLRVYEAHDGARFSTWLLVVARRLCVDFHRRRYGRPQGAKDHADHAVLDRAARRRLVDLAAEEIDIDSLTDTRDDSPEARVRSAELRDALATALDALAPADRLLLVMRFDDGRSASSIAQALGLPTPFHVYRRLAHIFGRLRSTLAAKGVDDPSP
jgi:RNA polymerase sigma factor (sigma-70 family)